MKKATFIIVALAILASADVFELEPVEDTYVYLLTKWYDYSPYPEEYYGDMNFGEASYCGFGRGFYYTPGYFNNNYAETYIKYDLDSIPENQISKIFLDFNLILVPSWSEGCVCLVALIGQEWDETTVTYYTKPSLSEVVGEFIILNHMDDINIQLKHDVINSNYDLFKEYGLCIYCIMSQYGGWYGSLAEIPSRESGDPSILTIYTSEPVCISANDNDTEDLTVTETTWGAIKVGNR